MEKLTKKWQTRKGNKKKPDKSKERKKAIKYADTQFSLYIRKRDPFCYCGKQTEQCGHLITRAVYMTRWDENNAAGCCAGCNIKHEYRPEFFTLAYIKRFGILQFEQLMVESHKASKFTTRDIIDTGDVFKIKREELCNLKEGSQPEEESRIEFFW